MAESQTSNVSQPKPRTNSISQASEDSQTAADFIKEQLSLEAEAREALPYQFDTCTRDLGPLRQGLYSCLDCNPPTTNSSDPYQPAAVCYACSISCHGEHTLVELFNKRNFVCDCGTTRLPETTPCTLRINSETGQKGGVAREEPARGNKYNQNFRNKFCGCSEEYDPHQEKGTMFQCLGLGTVEDGGCGEDWWHPECVLGLSREEFKKSIEKPKMEQKEGDVKANGITKDVSVTRHEEEAGRDPDARRPSVMTAIAAGLPTGNGVDGNDVAAQIEDEEEDEDTPLPPSFPAENDFEYFLCYKCVEAFPWIKKYASSPGFVPPVYFDAALNQTKAPEASSHTTGATNGDPKKRKADDGEDIAPAGSMAPPKRQKSMDPATALSTVLEDAPSTILPLTPKKADSTSTSAPQCKLTSLPLFPPSPSKPFSLFMKPDFHSHICHCATCFPLLKPHPQLLEEEDVYEPPISEDGNDATASVGTGSLLERGEAAFSNMDRARAIQGAMAFAHLKDGLKAFLKPYADEGKAVGAEDINVFFQKLRGDDAAIKEAGAGAKRNQEPDGDEADSDNRREQSGY
ncbi:uncharacterized protein N0V89_011000 [Didymosphaeria variabile]|uniref:UBR-type domain-containing protein n=1 Tax=Didymosphaeria variabile TaxID=1932322 RepID=A0A9W8XCQ6_9PLEO|nr:uncharacterized protein N0V89_011000 [Didymosphaeria variabile]KAJ4347065.1 hypothetical protein N0V89_011000 [Didymosphaeria variabile]